MTADAAFARKLFSGPCEFVAGAMSLDALPETGLPEVAFVGRSNAGKSSLINALTGRTSLARVSHTPGRTRQINLFRLRDALVLADLPGYGFSRISKAEAAHWDSLITGYLHTRRTLRCVVLLLDARRGIMTSDKEAMTLLDEAAVSHQLVLTKTDALKAAELQRVTAEVQTVVSQHPAALAAIIVTSARSSFGIAELRQSLAELASH